MAYAHGVFAQVCLGKDSDPQRGKRRRQQYKTKFGRGSGASGLLSPHLLGPLSNLQQHVIERRFLVVNRPDNRL